MSEIKHQAGVLGCTLSLDSYFQYMYLRAPYSTKRGMIDVARAAINHQIVRIVSVEFEPFFWSPAQYIN